MRMPYHPPAGPLCALQEGGLFVAKLGCWLDSGRPRPKCFVSHAHTDHYAAHETIVCTPETGAMLWLLCPYGEPPPPHKPLAYHRIVGPEDARTQLLPSGHILGAAMLHVAGEGASLLYAGDVRPSGSATTPPAEPVAADHLIVEDTFGALDEEFVGPAEGAARVVEFCRQAREEGATPVLVTLSNCGKAQDMMLALSQAGMTAAVQSKIWRFAEVYRRFGVPLRGYRRLDPNAPVEADVVIVTRAFLGYHDLRLNMPKPRFALVSGWAASPDAQEFDAAIPWSDHASRSELLQFIEAVNPKVVWTFAGEGKLLPELRAAGREARHLGQLG